MFSGLLKPVNVSFPLEKRCGVSTPYDANKTAREKHRSVSAEEAAAVPAATTDVVTADSSDRVMKSQQPRFYGGPLKAAMSHAVHPPSSRSKTLAWFLADDLLEKKSNGEWYTLDFYPLLVQLLGEFATPIIGVGFPGEQWSRKL
ncbi:unnamed protein product [Nippostrongylus brasiliensis]|uniref:Pecanex-like protein n=1 Tax=Nippostrongylus brasiliensis TaxID=27835 RepID=A0A0N4XTC7_NIPBR|nr:unnamed protein product [Nippostrongylus brasiliensis]